MAEFAIPLSLEVGPIDRAGLDRVAAVFVQELEAACRDIGEHVQGRIQRIIIDEKIWYTGTLLNSITWSLIQETAAAIGVAVGTDVAYAKYQEFGTVPHFVPFHLAKTLYDQAVYDWGWLKVEPQTSAALNARPGQAVRQGPAGMFLVTGKRQTYLTKHPERLWLKPYPDAKPVWGLVVSGAPQPFLYPGWEQSLEFVEERLLEACRRAAERVGEGG